MTREQVLEGVREVFFDVFDDMTLVVVDSTNADDIEDWDSLEHINLIVGIESRFGIKFKMDEVAKMKDVGEMVDAIIKRV